MNNNPLLGQVLGGLFGQALGRRRGGIGGMGGLRGPLGGGLGGMGGLGGGLGGAALGTILGGMLSGGMRRGPMGLPARGGINRTALLVMLLPLAMRWVQNNGGMNAVLDKFRQKGMSRHANSWVSAEDNEPIDEQAVQQVVGPAELRAMAQRLGVPEHEVAQAFADIVPEMVDKLSPEGEVPAEADAVLEEGRQALEREIEDVQFREVQRPS